MTNYARLVDHSAAQNGSDVRLTDLFDTDDFITKPDWWTSDEAALERIYQNHMDEWKAANQWFVTVPDSAASGATSNGDGTYTNPTPPPSPTPPLMWDAFTFTRRFTQAERVAMRTLGATNPDAADFLDLLDKAGMTNTMIHANDPDTIAALAAFEGAGLIGTGRAAIILSAAPSPGS